MEKSASVLAKPMLLFFGMAITRPERTLTLVVAIGQQHVGLDRYFLEMGEPAKTMSVPMDAVTYVVVDPERAISTDARNGIRILTPEEASELITCYAGFGESITPTTASI